MSNKIINALIVDDSALIRALLQKLLESDPQIRVCGVAADPFEAREKIKKLNPDVLTLDIEMPKMNGISFLKNLMRLRPMPVVMISTLTQEGAPATLEALELGAVDFVPKPKTDVSDKLALYTEEICEKVKTAASANIAAFKARESTPQPKKHIPTLTGSCRQNYLCAIGASTGGTEAIKEVVAALPANGPPIVVAQHIPENFSRSFAKRVNDASVLTVYEAEHQQPIKSGEVYIAPGHSHLKVERRGGQFVCILDQTERVNRHRPSVEVLFDSVTTATSGNCMGAILTGMGADGAEALLRMRQAGAKTIAQDEATSVVWGMPGVAVKLQAADKVVPIANVANEITNDFIQQKHAKF